MKRVLSCLVVLALMLSLIPAGAVELHFTAKAENVSGHYIYTVLEGEATITEVNPAIKGAVTVPETLGGYPVTCIGCEAFSNCADITSLTIGDNVKTIKGSAIISCPALTSIFIGKGVTQIEKGDIYRYLFSSCYNITEIVVDSENPVYHSSGNCLIETATKSMLRGCKTSVIPDDGSVTWVYNHAFSRSTAPESVVFPGCMTEFPGALFAASLYGNVRSYNLSTVVIHEGVTKIGYRAFCSSGISTVYIPRSVTEIEEGAFAGCENLVVWYGGSESDRENILIDSANSALQWGTWHYNTHFSHEYDNACDADCNVCGAIREIRETDHTYDNACDADCNVCGAIREIRETDHTYDNACDADCNVCGATRTPPHAYTDGSDFTCNLCTGSRTPAAPTAENVLATAVVLQAVEGCEYSRDGVTWQTAVRFDGLQPLTEYTFYQRVQGTADREESAQSDPLRVTTVKGYTVSFNANGGSVVPSSKIRNPGETLKVSGYSATRSGYAFLGWSTTPGSDTLVTSVSKDADCVLYARWGRACSPCLGRGVLVREETEYTVCGRCDQGWITSTGERKCKSCGGRNFISVPGGTVGGTTTSAYSICAACGSTNIGYESVYNKCTTCGGDGLLTSVVPYVEDCYHCSAKGYYLVANGKMEAPTAVDVGTDYVELTFIEGVEYSKDGYSWQVSNIFNGLTPNRRYTFYQRYQANALNLAGETSNALTMATACAHRYDNACDADCNTCGATRTAAEHTYSNACDASCNTCGAIRTITHTYNNACDASCNVCGETRTPAAHVYTDDRDANCNVCGAVREVKGGMLGDVDGNGKIDSTDARLVLQYAVQKVSASVLDIAAADVDGNGKVDSTDARLILQYSVKKIQKFPGA